MVWNLNNPPVIVYITVRELVNLATEGNVSKTQDQIVTIGVEMIWKTQDPETGLIEWFKRPAVEYTWNTFMPHLIEAHTALKQNIGPTLRNTAYRQENEMAAELKTKLRG